MERPEVLTVLVPWGGLPNQHGFVWPNHIAAFGIASSGHEQTRLIINSRPRTLSATRCYWLSLGGMNPDAFHDDYITISHASILDVNVFKTRFPGTTLISQRCPSGTPHGHRNTEMEQ